MVESKEFLHEVQPMMCFYDTFNVKYLSNTLLQKILTFNLLFICCILTLPSEFIWKGKLNRKLKCNLLSLDKISKLKESKDSFPGLTKLVDIKNTHLYIHKRIQSGILNLQPRLSVDPRSWSINESDGNFYIQAVQSIHHGMHGPAGRVCHGLKSCFSTGTKKWTEVTTNVDCIHYEINILLNYT